MKEKWFRLDNAAKVFPSISKANRTNIFRLSFTLTEEINPTLLKEAIDIVLDRFSSIKTTIRRGLFWYYLEPNKKDIPLEKETSYVCSEINPKENNGYFFRFLYFKSKISIEVFHALTDGTGALEILKSVVFTYLNLSGIKIENDGQIITDDIEERLEETKDSFLTNYDKKIKQDKKDPKSCKIDGVNYDDNYVSIIKGVCSVSSIKEVSKKYNCTVNELITACIVYSASRSLNLIKYKNRPFQVVVPVNLRKYFNSRTMRNFSLYVTTSDYIDKEKSIEEYIASISSQMKKMLTKEEMVKRIGSNVRIEKLFIMRIIPLFLKEIALRIGYNKIGEVQNSLSLSNLGVVKLPSEMTKYVSGMEFINGTAKTVKCNLGVVSYDNKCTMTFVSQIEERNIQREFFRILAKLGLEVTVSSNDVEV